MANTELTRTTSSTDTGTKFTLSVWLKRTTTGTNNKIYHATNDSNTNSYIDYTIASNDRLDFQIKNGSGTTFIRRRTNRLFRDTSAWYHLVARYDSTQSTASDRIRLYVNGELETSIDQDGTPDCPLNYTSQLALNSVPQNIGNIVSGSSQFFSGIMSHYHLCVGYSYAPTEFGETDSTTGEWKIKTSPSVSYGNNGFLILKDGNTITDQSPNSNDWTLAGGTLTKTEDNPSNVFCSGNSIGTARLGGGSLRPTSFSYGNNRLTLGSGGYTVRAVGTLAVASGKYYWEIKMISDCDSAGEPSVGIIGTGGNQNNYIGYTGNPSMLYKFNGQKGFNNTGNTTYGNSYDDGDIIGVALDLDNNAIYFSKNGAWETSGDPTSGASATGAMYSGTGTSDGFDPATDFWTPFFIGGSSSDPVMDLNFGNGYFGTTAVSSAGTNASGIGIFEHDCPNGYTALSTKGLNE